MPNINTLKVVVHEKKIYKGFCYINLHVYKKYVPSGHDHLMTRGNLLEHTLISCS